MKLLGVLLLLAVPVASGRDLKEHAIDLDKFREGDPPREIFVIEGSMRIKGRKGGNVIEISGDRPEVDARAAIGPSAAGPVTIEARILATRSGRSYPRFGVGVHGQAGLRLLVVPARKQLQLVKDEQVLRSAPFDWASGEPVLIRLAVGPDGAGKWTVTGKAWKAGTPEPADAQIALEITSPTTRGQCSITGTPYSGTPIEFDAIKVGSEG